MDLICVVAVEAAARQSQDWDLEVFHYRKYNGALLEEEIWVSACHRRYFWTEIFCKVKSNTERIVAPGILSDAGTAKEMKFSINLCF